MKITKLKLTAGLMAVLVSASTFGATTLVNDTYTIATAGTGFALGSGVNTGINPPTNRITGSVASSLRYYQTATNKPASVYDINSNRLRINTDGGIGRFTLSANGSTPFDFAPALGTAYASPTNPAIYDIKITMRNNASTAARFSFALGTLEGDANSWDFGVQLYRATTSDDFYTIQKRIDIGSSGVADINAPMGTTGPGTWVSGSQASISFLIRVTDAGAEGGTDYNSRIQVSIDNGTNWIYSSTNDAALPSGWRLDGSARYIIFDQAANTSGTVFYDNLSVISTYSPTPPAGRTWTGAGADDNWSTADNWGGAAPVTGEPLVFDGTTRQANINDIVGLTVPSVTLNNGGFSLSGNPLSVSLAISNLAGNNLFAGDLAWSSTASKTWNIAIGSEVVLSNTTSVGFTGDHEVIGGGTLRLKGTMNFTANPVFAINDGKQIIDGGTFSSIGGYRIGSLATGTGAQTILTNGASLAITATGGALRVGDSANPVASRLDIYNSTLTLAGGVVLGIPYAANATGIVNQVGGTVSSGAVVFNDNGAGSGTYNIKNGTLEPTQIREDFTAGASSIYFDNAILRTASGANTTFFSGLNVAEIQAGGLTIDAQTDVNIAQVLSGTGTLTKTGSAAANLTGANIYSGNTLIQSGKLSLPTVQTNAAAVQVADGAELGVSVRSPGTTLSVASVNFAGSSFGTLSFDLGSFPTPTAPLMKVTSLSVNGPVTINVANGVQLTTGQIVLVDYDGSLTGGFNFTLGSLPPGVNATLINNTANGSIDLNITGVPGFRWTGANSGDWDTSTENWLNLQTGLPSAYSDGFPTEFLDGATTGIINIVGFPTSPIITVSNNTLPYVWSGGAITAPSVKKYGTNSLTRVESAPDQIASIELNQGSFSVSNAFDSAFATILTDAPGGTGTFVKQGASTLTVSSTNTTYDGKILIQEGTLKLGNTASLGSTNGGTTIASGATLDLNDIVVAHEPVIVSGQGVGTVGAIIDSTTGGAVAHNLTDVTMTGDTTFGAPNGGRWDIRVRSSSGPGPGLRGNGFNLTKVGSGSVSIACQRSLGTNTPYWQMNLGDVVINAGSLAFAESLTLGNPSKTITINPGAAIQLFDLGFTNPIVRNIFMTDAKLNCGGGNTDTNVINGSINLTGANSIRPDQAVLIINGSITGSGSLGISAVEPGRVYLNGVNTYSGDITVTNGTLGGYGVIAGNLIMLGGTNAPGMGIGTLTVNGDATLAGTTLIELNRSQSPNCDRLVVGGALSWSGNLTVVLDAGAPAPQAGDVYQLFNKAGTGSFSTITLPNLSGLPGGLSWNTNNLAVNGTISVTGTTAPPTINSVYVSGSNLIFGGSGGIQGNSYVVLSSTNVATPVANWTPVATNVFGSGGSFTVTNAINPTMPATFFLLQVP